MIDDNVKALLIFWRERCGLKKDIKFRRVPRSHWDGNTNRHLWGISADGEFLYSATPSEETIVHEVVHFKWPRFTEQEVRQITRALLY